MRVGHCEQATRRHTYTPTHTPTHLGCSLVPPPGRGAAAVAVRLVSPRSPRSHNSSSLSAPPLATRGAGAAVAKGKRASASWPTSVASGVARGGAPLLPPPPPRCTHSHGGTGQEDQGRGRRVRKWVTLFVGRDVGRTTGVMQHETCSPNNNTVCAATTSQAYNNTQSVCVTAAPLCVAVLAVWLCSTRTAAVSLCASPPPLGGLAAHGSCSPAGEGNAKATKMWRSGAGGTCNTHT